MKIFTIIKEDSKRIPNKNFVDVNGHPLWWHLLSELEGLDVTVNTDSQKFIKQLEEIDTRLPTKDFKNMLIGKMIRVLTLVQ